MMKGIRLELIKTLGSKRFAISIFMIALGMLLNFITDSRYSRYTSVDVCLAAAFDKSFSLTILYHRLYAIANKKAQVAPRLVMMRRLTHRFKCDFQF